MKLLAAALSMPLRSMTEIRRPFLSCIPSVMSPTMSAFSVIFVSCSIGYVFRDCKFSHLHPLKQFSCQKGRKGPRFYAAVSRTAALYGRRRALPTKPAMCCRLLKTRRISTNSFLSLSLPRWLCTGSRAG